MSHFKVGLDVDSIGSIFILLMIKLDLERSSGLRRVMLQLEISTEGSRSQVFDTSASYSSKVYSDYFLSVLIFLTFCTLSHILFIAF